MSKNLLFEKKTFPLIGSVYSHFLGTKHLSIEDMSVKGTTLQNRTDPPAGELRFKAIVDNDTSIYSYKHKKIEAFFYLKHQYTVSDKGYVAEDWYLCKK